MRGAPTVLLVLVEAFLCVPALADEAPSRIAVFPLAGESVSVADLPTVDAIDREVRQATKAKVGAALQPRDMTMTHVQVLKDVGLVCATDDIECQSRIAIMADVDLAIIGVVSLRPGSHALRLVLLDRESSSVIARVEGPIAESGPTRAHDIETLVSRLVVERPNEAPAPVVVPPVAAPVVLPETKPDAAPPPAVVVEEESPLAWWLLISGGAIAAGAGVATVAALGAALGLEVILSNPMPWTMRMPLAITGQVMLGLAAVSLVALVVGGALAGASFAVE